MNKIIFRTCLVLSLLVSCAAGARKYSRFHEQPDKKRELVEKLTKKSAEDKRNATAWAKAHGVPMRTQTGSKITELMAIRDGIPVYYTTLNNNAAISTAANRVRDESPYNLDGTGIRIGVWDGATARGTHQELVGRILLFDVGEEVDKNGDHSTHICGTIGASGLVSDAKGMAPAAEMYSYDWYDDIVEMLSWAADAPGLVGGERMYISNHSYTAIASIEWFGQYGEDVRQIDDIVHDLQYYLPFIAAGNSRNDWGIPNKGGYDTISFYGIAKNVITVGAVNDAVSGSTRSVNNATMSTFSSWGPADDGRVKPDVVANGVGLYSTYGGGNAEYGPASGTSMACPNACGSAALLVEYYDARFPGNAMWSSTLKGLIIHTADDLGRPGPDYAYGWGLMNTLAAADMLKDYADGTTLRLTEDELTDSNQSDEYSFIAGGHEPIRVTLCWTDPPGTSTNVLDSRTRVLVNDLDLKVIGPGGTTNYPYKLSYSNPSANATATGENNTDNVEQVYINAPVAGEYTILVDYDEVSLTGAEQRYSLLVDGVSGDDDADGMLDNWERFYLGSTNALATADSDGDGSNNVDEYITGYDPTDSNSVFSVVFSDVLSTAGSPFIITWNPVEGRIYNVLWTENLLSPPLFTDNNLSGDLPYPINSYTDLVERTSPRNFYRVDVRLAE